MNSRDYIENAIHLAKKIMEKKEKVFVYGKQSKRPMLMRYRSELDVFQVLNPKEAKENQKFVGIAHCIIELGSFNILYEVLLLSIHLDMTQKGHMEALMGIFVYLENAFGKTIFIHLMIPKVNTLMEINMNWTNSIYGEDN